MPAPLVETEGLGKAYGPRWALRDAAFQVREGEVFGLLGPNGAGKSTLIRLLMGFLRPTAGAARILGHDCLRDRLATHRHVAYLPGEVRLFRRFTGRQMLDFLAKIHPAGRLERSLRLIERFGLDISRSISQYSTGMRQQLALAATFALDTPLIILDEPTSNLDPTMRRLVQRMLREARDEGRSVVLSSHVMAEIEHVADRAVILRGGEIVHEQVLAELRWQHRITARLHGPLPAPPTELADQLTLTVSDEEDLMVKTSGELSPFLGWLATLPIAEARVTPIGLQSVYDRFHIEEMD